MFYILYYLFHTINCLLYHMLNTMYDLIFYDIIIYTLYIYMCVCAYMDFGVWGSSKVWQEVMVRYATEGQIQRVNDVELNLGLFRLGNLGFANVTCWQLKQLAIDTFLQKSTYIDWI